MWSGSKRIEADLMGKPAAKQGDKIVATDIHILLIPAAAGVPVPTPTPMPFSGMITTGVSTDVFIEGKPAAVVNSVAINQPIHIPAGGPFQKPPMNQGKIIVGSTGVFINGKPAARSGDMAITCNDPVDMPIGQVVAVSKVFIGETGAGTPRPPSQSPKRSPLSAKSGESGGAGQGGAGSDAGGSESSSQPPEEGKLIKAKWGQPGKIVDANWEKDRAKVGEEVKLIANLKDFDDGTPAKILVWQKKEAEDVFISEIDAKVRGNKVEASWKELDKDQGEEKARVANQEELTYYFTVDIEGEDARSKDLLITREMKEVELWVTADLLSEDGSTRLSEVEYVLVYPDGTEVRGVTDEKGHLEQKVLEEGDYAIRILNDFEEVEEPNEEYEEEECEKKDYISVNLYDETAENPASNTEYKLVCPDGTEIQGATDENGHFEHKNMPQGEYILLAKGNRIRIPSKSDPEPYDQRIC
jgi:uncharacterized Zn-binding protein involved in type VI secretion